MKASVAASVLCLGLGISAPSQAAVTPDLLLSSAWCTFKYNKVSGYSSSTRVTFNSNGVWASGSRGEGGSSGRSGSVYSQRDSGDGGRWAVQNGELFMSGGGQMEHVRTIVKRNNNGFPIIVADGVEYSQCQ
jgi:hypothetical protein